MYKGIKKREKGEFIRCLGRCQNLSMFKSNTYSRSIMFVHVKIRYKSPSVQNKSLEKKDKILI